MQDYYVYYFFHDIYSFVFVHIVSFCVLTVCDVGRGGRGRKGGGGSSFRSYNSPLQLIPHEIKLLILNSSQQLDSYM